MVVDVFDLPDSAAVSRDVQDIFAVTKFQLQLSHGTDYDVSVEDKTSHCKSIAVPGSCERPKSLLQSPSKLGFWNSASQSHSASQGLTIP